MNVVFVQAFPYFYVPYDNDFPTDPLQGAGHHLIPLYTSFKCVASTLSTRGSRIVRGHLPASTVTHCCWGRIKDMIGAAWIATALTRMLPCCSTSICAPLCTCHGERNARWAGVWGAAPPTSVCSAARTRNPILRLSAGRGAVSEDHHVRAPLMCLRTQQLLSYWYMVPDQGTDLRTVWLLLLVVCTPCQGSGTIFTLAHQSHGPGQRAQKESACCVGTTRQMLAEQPSCYREAEWWGRICSPMRRMCPFCCSSRST